MAGTGTSVAAMIKRFRDEKPTSQQERSRGKTEKMWWDKTGEGTGFTSPAPSPVRASAPAPVVKTMNSSVDVDDLIAKEIRMLQQDTGIKPATFSTATTPQKYRDLETSVNVDDLIAREIRQLERDIKFTGNSSMDYSSIGTREAKRDTKSSYSYQPSKRDVNQGRSQFPRPDHSRKSVDTARMSFETLGSREGFHGLCLPGLRLDDGRYDTKPLTKEEQDLKEKKDKESGAYFVTGEGDNPYSTLNDVKARVEDLLKGFSVKTQELDGRDAEDDIAAKTYISLGTASPPYPTPQDVPTITTIPEVTDKLDLHMRAYEVLHKPSLDAENAEIEHTKQLEQVRAEGIAAGQKEERESMEMLDLMFPLDGCDRIMQHTAHSTHHPHAHTLSAASTEHREPDRPIPMNAHSNEFLAQDEAMCMLDEVLRTGVRRNAPPIPQVVPDINVPMVLWTGQSSSPALAPQMYSTVTSPAATSLCVLPLSDPNHKSILATRKAVDTDLKTAMDRLLLKLPADGATATGDHDKSTTITATATPKPKGVPNKDKDIGKDKDSGKDKNTGKDRDPGKDKDSGKDKDPGKDKDTGKDKDSGKDKDTGKGKAILSPAKMLANSVVEGAVKEGLGLRAKVSSIGDAQPVKDEKEGNDDNKGLLTNAAADKSADKAGKSGDKGDKKVKISTDESVEEPLADVAKGPTTSGLTESASGGVGSINDTKDRHRVLDDIDDRLELLTMLAEPLRVPTSRSTPLTQPSVAAESVHAAITTSSTNVKSTTCDVNVVPPLDELIAQPLSGSEINAPKPGRAVPGHAVSSPRHRFMAESSMHNTAPPAGMHEHLGSARATDVFPGETSVSHQMAPPVVPHAGAATATAPPTMLVHTIMPPSLAAVSHASAATYRRNHRTNHDAYELSSHASRLSQTQQNHTHYPIYPATAAGVVPADLDSLSYAPLDSRRGRPLAAEGGAMKHLHQVKRRQEANLSGVSPPQTQIVTIGGQESPPTSSAQPPQFSSPTSVTAAPSSYQYPIVPTPGKSFPNILHEEREMEKRFRQHTSVQSAITSQSQLEGRRSSGEFMRPVSQAKPSNLPPSSFLDRSNYLQQMKQLRKQASR